MCGLSGINPIYYKDPKPCKICSKLCYGKKYCRDCYNKMRSGGELNKDLKTEIVRLSKGLKKILVKDVLKVINEIIGTH